MANTGGDDTQLRLQSVVQGSHRDAETSVDHVGSEGVEVRVGEYQRPDVLG